MKELDLILKRILERSKQIRKLRLENDADRELVSEYEGRKGGSDEHDARN